jgi:lipopolysaccharide transport system permease protein
MEIFIESGKTEKNYWKDIWRYRELFYILSWRDIKVRYKQTVLGAGWSIIRPLLTTIILTFVFSKVAKLEGPQTFPYILLVFTAMLPWQFFSNSLSEASNSLVGNSNLITKVYFPRIIIPVSTIITSVIDFFVSLSILSIIMVWYQVLPPLQVLLLPLFLIQVFIFALGFSLWLTALNVKYRDFRYIIPFIIQTGLYLTPVGFSSNTIPEEWQLLYSINPMVGIIDVFRWCILNTPFNTSSYLVSLAVTFLFIWFGIYYFRRMERTFADNI